MNDPGMWAVQEKKVGTPLPPPVQKQAVQKPKRKPPGKTVVGPSAAQLLASRLGGGTMVASAEQPQQPIVGLTASASVATTAKHRSSGSMQELASGGNIRQLPAGPGPGSSALAAPLHQPAAAAVAGRSAATTAAAPSTAPAASDSARPGPASSARSSARESAAATTLPPNASAPAPDGPERPGRAHAAASNVSLLQQRTPQAVASLAARVALEGSTQRPSQGYRWPAAAAAAGHPDAHSERPGRAQAAADRAHNAAVLAEAALSSEALARLLQEQELRGARRGTGAGRC